MAKDTVRVSTEMEVRALRKPQYGGHMYQGKALDIYLNLCGRFDYFVIFINMKECPKCGNNHHKKGKFCSRSCANSRTWSKEDKSKKSEIAKKSEKVLLANRDPERRKNLSISAKAQAKVGNINWSKLHTKDVINKALKTKKLKRELWLDSFDRSDKIEYRKACKFKFSLNSYPDKFDFWLIEEYGWYKAKNMGDNPNGISRDHMYSISEGFKNGVDPYYISHPANCKLMRHGENNKKDGKSSINLEDLIKKVNKWDNKYGPLA